MIKNEYIRKYYSKNKTRILYQQRWYQKNIRNKLFNMVGKNCVHCGFLDKRALQIDHINGGGWSEYKQQGNINKMYKFYIQNPELAKKRLQILCANCNWIKRYENNETRKAS